MALCKVNKITVICEKWKRKSIESEEAMQEIQKIIDLKESEMPPCTCKPKDTNSSPSAKPNTVSCSCTINPQESSSCTCTLKPQQTACPIEPKTSASCPSMETASCSPEKSQSCHSPGPCKTFSSFFIRDTKFASLSSNNQSIF